MNKEVTLTEHELEDLKDTIKFRTKVVMQLKQINGLPDRVKAVETKVLMFMWGIPIVSGIGYTIFKVVTK